METAAGGCSQRLKPGGATIAGLSMNAGHLVCSVRPGCAAVSLRSERSVSAAADPSHLGEQHGALSSRAALRRPAGGQ